MDSVCSRKAMEFGYGGLQSTTSVVNCPRAMVGRVIGKGGAICWTAARPKLQTSSRIVCRLLQMSRRAERFVSYLVYHLGCRDGVSAALMN